MKNKTNIKGGKSMFFLLFLIISASLLLMNSSQAAKNKIELNKAVITNINGNTITATRKGKIYTIDATSAKLYSDNNKKIYLDQIYIGDKIYVKGKIFTSIIQASYIKDLSIKKKNLNSRIHSVSPVVSASSSAGGSSSYPLHTNITSTVFWVGEPVGNGSTENNALSAWDDAWQTHYGCLDDPFKRNGYFPVECTPQENPFYIALPYDDFTDNSRRADASQVVPWANSKSWADNESMLKNRWIKIIRDNNICYAQWEDTGPYVYDDAGYVFGTNDQKPKNPEANNSGMDVSPAVRDCLKFQGLNEDTNKISWQFLEAGDVPDGPWKNIVTTSGTYWP